MPFLQYNQAFSYAQTIIILNGDANGGTCVSNEGLCDNSPFTPVGGNNAATLGQARLNALQEAADILSSAIQPNVNIFVNAKFDPLGGSAFSAPLAFAGPTTIHANFPNAPQLNVWYASPLANHLAGSDLNGITNEINATFNTDLDSFAVLGNID